MLFNEFNSDDVYLLYRKVDVFNRGSLNFQDFSSAVLPFSREYAALVTDRPDYFITRGCDFTRFFNVDTREEFQAFWRTFFKAERAAESLRVRIAKRPYFKLNLAFEFIDRNQDGYLDSRELRNVLADSGFYVTERELNGLINRLDRDRDGRISYNEFVEELTARLADSF